MVNLEKYRKHLINYCREGYDNNEEKAKERSQALDRKYNDSFLDRVVKDSYDFLHDILDNEYIKNDYLLMPLEEGTNIYLTLGLIGGHSSDIIYITEGHRLVSRYIVKKEMGQDFYIEIEEKENTEKNDDDIMNTGIEYYLYMRHFPLNTKEIKENLFGKSLVKRNNEE